MGKLRLEFLQLRDESLFVTEPLFKDLAFLLLSFELVLDDGIQLCFKLPISDFVLRCLVVVYGVWRGQ